MKLRIAHAALACVLVFVGPVSAQTPPGPAPAAGARPASADHTVSGVTVEAQRPPTKECGSRDRACIAMVVAELKQRYPEQLQRFCFQREMRAMQQGVWFGPNSPSESGGDYRTPSSLRIACARDKPK